MTLRRHSFIAFLLVAAVVSLFFSPLLPTPGLSSRQHHRTTIALAASVAALQFSAASSFITPTAPLVQPTRSEDLIEWNCARLC